MGIYTSARIVVGWDYDEASILAGEQDVYDWTLENDIDRYSPYYDADSDACVYGIAVERTADFSAEVIDLSSLPFKAEQAKKELKQRLGCDENWIEPAVFLTPYVS